MNEFLVHIIIIILLVLACIAITNIAIFQPYTNSEKYCESIGMELDGWTPSGQTLTCKSLENEYVIKIQFEKIKEKYYPIKEEK